MATQAKAPEQIRDLWNGVWSNCALEHGSVVQDRFAVEAYQQIRRFISPGDKQILEAGCGTGRFCSLISREFPSARITGVDISEKSVAIAQRSR